MVLSYPFSHVNAPANANHRCSRSWVVEPGASIGCREHASLEHDGMREGKTLDLVACEDDKHARRLVVGNDLGNVLDAVCRREIGSDQIR